MQTYWRHETDRYIEHSVRGQQSWMTDEWYDPKRKNDDGTHPVFVTDENGAEQRVGVHDPRKYSYTERWVCVGEKCCKIQIRPAEDERTGRYRFQQGGVRQPVPIFELREGVETEVGIWPEPVPKLSPKVVFVAREEG